MVQISLKFPCDHYISQSVKFSGEIMPAEHSTVLACHCHGMSCVCYVLSHPEMKWEPIRNIDMADFSRSPGQGFISLQWESAGCSAATRRQMLPKLCLVTCGPGLPAQSSASDYHYPGDCQHSQDNG